MAHPVKVALATAQGAVGLLGAMGLDRLALALAIVVAVTVLAALGKLESTAAVGLYSVIVGYVVGAGHEAAKRGGPS